MPKIKINTFGEGIEIRQLKLDATTYQKWNTIAIKKNRSLPELLIDPFFYHGLKNTKVKSIHDLENTLVSGMLNTTKSHIEIWFNRKKVLKIQAHELFNEIVLFPLFNLEKNHTFIANDFEKGIYVIQKTIGLIVSQQLEIEEHYLNIKDFKFNTTEFKKEKILTDINYKKQYFEFIKSDSVITYQDSFEVL